VTSSAGVATYFFVTELAIATASYNDNFTDEEVTANDQLESTLWTAPPEDLDGFVAMPNGIFAGFKGNEIWFCEPYRPHAWPATYAIVVDYPIVGLGVINQTLIACTAGYPVAVTGLHPASMSQSKLTALEPCLSRGSILSAPEGVYYASPNGLVLVAGNTASNITRELVTKDRWDSLVSVATLRAARVGTAYYGFGMARAGAFDPDAFDNDAFAQEDSSESMSGVMIDPGNARVGFNLLTSADPTINVYNDVWSGEVFVIREGALYWMDLSESNETHDAYTWRSKIFKSPNKKNFAAMRVFFEVPPGTATQNPTRNTASPQTLADDQYGLIRVYADGDLVTTREIRTSGEIMRIPSGFKADEWQFEIEGRVNVSFLEVATSVKELKKV
jgi:hypothetical protein